MSKEVIESALNGFETSTYLLQEVKGFQPLLN